MNEKNYSKKKKYYFRIEMSFSRSKRTFLDYFNDLKNLGLDIIEGRKRNPEILNAEGCQAKLLTDDAINLFADKINSLYPYTSDFVQFTIGNYRINKFPVITTSSTDKVKKEFNTIVDKFASQQVMGKINIFNIVSSAQRITDIVNHTELKENSPLSKDEFSQLKEKLNKIIEILVYSVCPLAMDTKEGDGSYIAFLSGNWQNHVTTICGGFSHQSYRERCYNEVTSLMKETSELGTLWIPVYYQSSNTGYDDNWFGQLRTLIKYKLMDDDDFYNLYDNTQNGELKGYLGFIKVFRKMSDTTFSLFVSTVILCNISFNMENFYTTLIKNGLSLNKVKNERLESISIVQQDIPYLFVKIGEFSSSPKTNFIEFVYNYINNNIKRIYYKDEKLYYLDIMQPSYLSIIPGSEEEEVEKDINSDFFFNISGIDYQNIDMDDFLNKEGGKKRKQFPGIEEIPTKPKITKFDDIRRTIPSTINLTNVHRRHTPQMFTSDVFSNIRRETNVLTQPQFTSSTSIPTSGTFTGVIRTQSNIRPNIESTARNLFRPLSRTSSQTGNIISNVTGTNVLRRSQPQFGQSITTLRQLPLTTQTESTFRPIITDRGVQSTSTQPSINQFENTLRRVPTSDQFISTLQQTSRTNQPLTISQQSFNYPIERNISQQTSITSGQRTQPLSITNLPEESIIQTTSSTELNITNNFCSDFESLNINCNDICQNDSTNYNYFNIDIGRSWFNDTLSISTIVRPVPVDHSAIVENNLILKIENRIKSPQSLRIRYNNNSAFIVDKDEWTDIIRILSESTTLSKLIGRNDVNQYDTVLTMEHLRTLLINHINRVLQEPGTNIITSEVFFNQLSEIFNNNDIEIISHTNNVFFVSIPSNNTNNPCRFVFMIHPILLSNNLLTEPLFTNNLSFTPSIKNDNNGNQVLNMLDFNLDLFLIRNLFFYLYLIKQKSNSREYVFSTPYVVNNNIQVNNLNMNRINGCFYHIYFVAQETDNQELRNSPYVRTRNEIIRIVRNITLSLRNFLNRQSVV